MTAHPPAPFCEDCSSSDEEGQDTHVASANVSIKRSKSSESDTKPFPDKKSHDGSDSGYSSKAGTSDTMSTSSKKKGADLKVNTKSIERERHPYTYAPGRTGAVQPSPTKAKAVRIETPQKQPSRFQHDFGLCWVCDQYGYHFDISKEISRPQTAAPPQTQNPPRSVPTKPMSKEESDVRPPTIRRSSSKRESRPVSMFVHQSSYAFPPPVQYEHPELAVHNWQTPPMQMPPYPQYHHAYAPPTPLSSSYTQPGYLDQAMHYAPYAEHQYNDPASFYRPHEPERETKRVSSNELKRRETHKSTRVADADRLAMPPPPRPEPVRPIARKSPTEQVTSASRRRSSYIDEDEQAELRELLRERRPSQTRPPSAYKQNNDAYERPRARKSSSYSSGTGVVQVASSHREMPRRRTDPVEQRQLEIEAYIAKHGAANLTADALRRLEPKRSNPPSEAGSTRSSKNSVGRTRADTSVTSAPRTNITMDNGISFSIPADCGDTPLEFAFGNLRLSMNTGREDERPELKRIERAPSEVSQASRRSLTSGSGASVAKVRDDAQALTREAYRQKASANSSKKSSRAPSSTRADLGRKHGRRDDYPQLDESYYFSPQF